NGGYATLAEGFRKTKTNSANGVANRNVSLIADPSMVLALPEYSIQGTSAKTADGSDTLKALSTAIASGEIYGPGCTQALHFNGVIEATLFAEEKTFVTIGKTTPPFQYSQCDNALFRGRARARNGAFTFCFVMPENIAAQVCNGKL